MSVRTVVPKVGVVESWNSYLVVPVTGDQENAGLWLAIVEPLTGEEMEGTAAATGWMVKVRVSDQALLIGLNALTLQ